VHNTDAILHYLTRAALRALLLKDRCIQRAKAGRITDQVERSIVSTGKTILN